MKKYRWVIGVVLSIGVIVYVLLSLDFSEVAATFQSLSLPTLGLAFLLYLANYVLRTARFSVLLDLSSIPFPRLLGVTDLYGMYLYLLPAKFGEVTFPLLLKRRLNVDLSKSTGTLIVARLFDFFTITLLLVGVLGYYWGIFPAYLRVLSIVFCAVVLLGSIVFVWLIRHPARIQPWFEGGSAAGSFASKVREFLAGVYEGAQVVDRGRKYLAIFGLTVGIWLCVNGNFLLITSALGYSFTFFQIVVVSMIMVPVTLFPVQGFANLGAHELGWVTAFALFDYSYQAALNIAISSHIIYIFFVIVLGSFGSLLLAGSGNPDAGEAG